MSVDAVPVATPAAPPADAIIRPFDFHPESSSDRLLKKLLPAWVISGALNLGIVTVLLIYGQLSKIAGVAASEAVIETAVEDKLDDTKPEDLTNKDIGLDSEIPNAIDSKVDANVTIQAPDAPTEPVGAPMSDKTTPQDFSAPPGLAATELTTPGFTGDMGNLLAGMGGANGNILNPGMRGRSGATKDALVRAGGGNAESEAAVARGLAWLAKQQRQNGSWVYDGNRSGDVAASTGMALLPFLAAGQTHKPSGSRVEYYPYVERGLNYLLANQDPKTGRFRGVTDAYGQAIATIALCEAYGMTGDKSKLLGPTQKAINYIQRQQGSDGSWGYNGGTGDTSIVGWQIQALKSAQMCRDVVVDKQVLNRAKSFLDKIAVGSDKAMYGYSMANPGRAAKGTGLTAVGLLCQYYLGMGPDSPPIVNGVAGLIERNPPKNASMDMYYIYYSTQVVHFHGGKEWSEQWNPKIRDALIKMQVKDGTQLGSWEPNLDTYWLRDNTGRLGVTCMSLLTLEVYYRHLPLYKRDNSGLKELERVR